MPLGLGVPGANEPPVVPPDALLHAEDGGVLGGHEDVEEERRVHEEGIPRVISWKTHLSIENNESINKYG